MLPPALGTCPQSPSTPRARPRPRTDVIVVDPRHELDESGVGPANLHGERALTRRWGDHFRIQAFVNPPLSPQPVHAGGGQHDGVGSSLIEALKPALDVAVQRHHLEVRPRGQKKAGPSWAVGAYDCILSQRFQGRSSTSCYQDIARIRAFWVRADHKARVLVKRNVLGAVHCDVDLTVDEGARDG